MKLIYAQGFSKNERLEGKPVVFNNVVQSMRTIFDVMTDQGIEFENKDNEVRNVPTNKSSLDCSSEILRLALTN